MFRIFSVLLILSSTAIAGEGMEVENSATRPKSALKTREKPETLVRFDVPEKKRRDRIITLKKSRFPTQEVYDLEVVWDETSQTQEYYLKLKKECTPGHCSKSCPFHETTIVKTKVQDYKFLRLGSSELQKNSVVFDMEWAYALNALERILGLTDEEFERYKYALKFTERAQFHILFETASYFLKVTENYTVDQMSVSIAQNQEAAELWYKNSPYSKICARDTLCAQSPGKKDKSKVDLQVTTDTPFYKAKLIMFHQRAITQLSKIVDSGLFESVKTDLLSRLNETLFNDQKSEIGIGFDPSQMDQVRRFFIGVKEYLYMNLSEEEEAFVRLLNADAETDDEDEVSTDYESSAGNQTDDEDEEGLDLRWDDEEDDLE